MARITTTTQKKNTMMPGTAYPATVLALATAASYPRPRNLFGGITVRMLAGQRQAKLPGERPRQGTLAPAEGHFPVVIVAAHGLLAASTLVLALLTALGIAAPE